MTEEKDERTLHVTIMGRTIGYAESWDYIDDAVGFFYNFAPLAIKPLIDELPTGDVQIDTNTGELCQYSEGDVHSTIDLVPLIVNLPKRPKE